MGRRSGGSAWRRPRGPCRRAPASRPRRRSTDVPGRSRPRSAISGSSAFSTSRSLCSSRGPALGDRLELAVAVELVAEQVAEQDRARAKLRSDGVEPQLVDLEQAELAGDARVRPRRREQRRGDPARHVRARVVVHELDPRLLEHARPPSPRSSSCRWWPRSARCRRAAARRASRSRRARVRISTLPGALVAPPPRRRESAPTARASASFGASVPAISALAPARRGECGVASLGRRRAR